MIIYDMCDVWLCNHSRCQTETLEQVGRKKDSPDRISFHVTTNLRSTSGPWPKHHAQGPTTTSLPVDIISPPNCLLHCLTKLHLTTV
jgi:hypothetical protein